MISQYLFMNFLEVIKILVLVSLPTLTGVPLQRLDSVVFGSCIQFQ
jgi:hypothetical protein